MPSLLPRYDSDSEDDDSDNEDDKSDVRVPTKPPLIVPKRGKAHHNKAAPNRLVNVIALKKIIDTNLIICPVCKSNDRKICDGNSKGFAMELVIRYGGCDKIEVAHRNTVYRLSAKLQKGKFKSISARKERKRMRNKLYKLERKHEVFLKLKDDCDSVCTTTPPPSYSDTTHPSDSDEETNEVNIRAMMAVFYNGVSPRDIGKTMSFLGVPGGCTFHNLFYERMDSFTETMQKELQIIVDEGLQKEIESTIAYVLANDYSQKEIKEYIQLFNANSSRIPDKIRPLQLSASYDMGWNKRSTGRVYDSLSGHAFLIGCRSGKVISFGVRAKKCAKCSRSKRLGTSPVSHFCTINHEGSSGSMEAKPALSLTTELFDKSKARLYLNEIVSDDDSTMRALLKHQSNNDKGRLPRNIPQPDFLADPSHKIKVMSQPFFNIVTKTKDPNKCKMIDALRMKKYIG